MHPDQRLQACFVGVRALNEIKDEIRLFYALFVRPLRGRGLYQPTPMIPLATGRLPEAWIRVELNHPHFRIGKKGDDCGSCVDDGSGISAAYVKPAWNALPQILAELLKIAPDLKEEVTLYESLGAHREPRIAPC